MKPWNKGLKGIYSDETKEKMRSSHLGKRKGVPPYKMTDAIKKKMSLSRMGKKPWNVGIKYSDEYRKKLSDAKIGRRILPDSHYEMLRKKFAGENAPNWRGGKTKMRSILMVMPEYKKWRKNVFQRDDYTCQECGERGCYLEAHHKKRVCEIMDEYQINSRESARNCQKLWDIGNGISLCIDCHEETKI